MVQQHPHREVNEQSYNIIQGRHEGTSCQGGIDFVVVEDEGDHGAEDCGEDNHAEQGNAYHHAQGGILKVIGDAVDEGR